jgi:hypothetical protein
MDKRQSERKIPNILLCEYCKRSDAHGGECRNIRRGNHEGCDAFKEDERGCIKKDTTFLLMPLFHEIPKIGFWSESEFGNVGKVRIIKFLTIDYYDNNQLKIGCTYEYFAPFDDGSEYKTDREDKPKLVLLKE